MDLQKFLREQELTNFPVGVISENQINSSNYDVFVFDGKNEQEKIIPSENGFVIVHHASLSETQSKKLLRYSQLQIIQDPTWDLQMFISKIHKKRLILYADFAKNCLIEAMFCCQKTKDSLDASDVFAPCWQKCAGCFLGDAILSLNYQNSNSLFMIDNFRKFETTQINEHISVLLQTIGIERSTPTLLERMLKSTIGFSDLIEKNNHSKIIQKNYDYFIKNSMLADCYFYLDYINKENFLKIKNNLNREQDFFHILKVAFDVESDPNLILEYSDIIQKSCTAIIENISRE